MNIIYYENFTKQFHNPEQSKRLLELGVPADSADMLIECYWCDGHNGMWRYKIGSHEIFRDRKQIGEGVGAIRPCWSVGRLIEIFCICTDDRWSIEYLNGMPQTIIEKTIEAINGNNVDFSKLEE